MTRVWTGKFRSRPVFFHVCGWESEFVETRQVN